MLNNYQKGQLFAFDMNVVNKVSTKYTIDSIELGGYHFSYKQGVEKHNKGKILREVKKGFFYTILHRKDTNKEDDISFMFDISETIGVKNFNDYQSKVLKKFDFGNLNAKKIVEHLMGYIATIENVDLKTQAQVLCNYITPQYETKNIKK